MNTNITELLPSLWAVKPRHNDACDFRIEKGRLVYNHGIFKSFTDSIPLPPVINMSMDKYSLIGKANELKEYYLMNIGLEDCPYFAKCWKNYAPTETPGKGATIYNPNVSCWTRVESLQSLLRSKGCDPSNTVLIKVEAI